MPNKYFSKMFFLSNTNSLRNRDLSILLFLTFLLSAVAQSNAQISQSITFFPANKSSDINPDTRLILTFEESPKLNNSGQIRIYDAADNKLVDLLDMSIPPGPKNTRTLSPYDTFVYKEIPDKTYTVNDPDTNQSHTYQKNYIGGTLEADAFHFYPIIIRDNKAIIIPHNNKLSYNKSYYVEIDAEIFNLSSRKFTGINGKTNWVFNTKKTGPTVAEPKYVVSADGTADFSTVQGAIDFIADNNSTEKTIFIKNGTYDEIIYFRNKTNVNFVGEDREKVVIWYANNGVFNTRLMSPDPALSKGSHSLRAVFTIHNSHKISLINFTLTSIGEKPAQAEALLIQGNENVVSHVNIEGSGDALQATGNIYITDSKIQGFGDNVLGYGAVYFNHCDFVSTYGPHLWVRNTRANHGNILVNCTLRTIGNIETTIARAPNNNGFSYPEVEAVLINCKLAGIRPEGWGTVADSINNIRYWEYKSTTIDGKPIDYTHRHPASKRLTWEKDSVLIKNYQTPSFV
jgi:pectinesterase